MQALLLVFEQDLYTRAMLRRIKNAEWIMGMVMVGELAAAEAVTHQEA